MSQLISSLINLVATLPKIWAVFVLAMMPIIELRGAIPLAIAWNIPPLTTFIIAFLGNMIPVLPLLFFLGPVSDWLQKHFAIFKSFFHWVFSRSKAHEDKIKRYGYWGLVLFVAIPFPGTGVWVGSALAFLLRLRILPSFLAMGLGVIIAGIVVISFSLGVAEIAAKQGLFWATLVVIFLLGLMLWQRKKQIR